MPYRAVLASVPVDEVARYRAGPAEAPITASSVTECPHDLTETEIQPLGEVLAEAIDIGQPLRNDAWHPLRAPVVVDPETVMARSMRLEEAWRAAQPELGGMLAELLGHDIDNVRAVYARASRDGETVVSYLTAPDDPDRAARTCIPDLRTA